MEKQHRSTSVCSCMGLPELRIIINDGFRPLKFHHCEHDARAIVIPRCIVIIQIIIRVRRIT